MMNSWLRPNHLDREADVADARSYRHSSRTANPQTQSCVAYAILLTCIEAKQHQARPSFAGLSHMTDKRSTTEAREPPGDQWRYSEAS